MAQIYFIKSERGKEMIVYKDNIFYLHSSHKEKAYWHCKFGVGKSTVNCRSRLILRNKSLCKELGTHNHEPDYAKLERTKFVSSLKDTIIENPSISILSAYKEKIKSTATSLEVATRLPAFDKIKNCLYRARNVLDKPEFELPQPHKDLSSTDQSIQALELNPNSSKVPPSSYKVIQKDPTALSSIPNVPIKLYRAASSNFIVPDFPTTEGRFLNVKIEKESSATLTDNVSKLSAVNKYEAVLTKMSCERFPDDQTHSQTVNIKIKQEIEDPLDTPLSNAQGDLSCQGLEKMRYVPSLFQPPVLIKEEIVSEEEL